MNDNNVNAENQLLQTLAKENAEMKADLKLLKERVYEVTEALKVTVNREMNPKFNIGSLMSTVSGIVATSMMGGEDKRFSGLKDLLPLIEKYKNL